MGVGQPRRRASVLRRAGWKHQRVREVWFPGSRVLITSSGGSFPLRTSHRPLQDPMDQPKTRIRYNQYSRGVAQPGSAPALGAGGRRFKSYRPDQSNFSQAGPFANSQWVADTQATTSLALASSSIRRRAESFNVSDKRRRFRRCIDLGVQLAVCRRPVQCTRSGWGLRPTVATPATLTPVKG